MHTFTIDTKVRNINTDETGTVFRVLPGGGYDIHWDDNTYSVVTPFDIEVA